MARSRRIKDENPTVDVQKEFVEMLDTNDKPVENKKTGGAYIISRIDYPETLDYGKSKIRVSPRAQLFIEDASQLQSKLPNGIVLKKV